MELTDKFCYIIGCANLTGKRLRTIMNNGYGLTKMHIMNISGWFMTTYICIFEKGKESIITVSPKAISYDISNCRCGKKCTGFPRGECSKNNFNSNI